MAKITEIAPDLFRITTFVEAFNMQFSQFLVCDNEPLLFHAGPRALFSEVKAAVSSLIDPRTLRWIGFSHFEADECATVPEWQQLAPHSEVVCSLVGKMVSVDDCWRFVQPKGWSMERCLRPDDTAFAFSPHPMCRIAGKRAWYSRRQNGRSCARIFFTKTEMWSR